MGSVSSFKLTPKPRTGERSHIAAIAVASYDFLESEILRVIFIRRVLTVRRARELELICIHDEEGDT